MEINLLGQGYEAKSENSVGYNLIKLFDDKDFHTFTGISAFTSQAGISGLSKYIFPAKNHLKIVSLVTGIDQQGTSKEALEELLALEINAYIFYQPSNPIFHPKIYLFEGNDKSDLIIGSSNLTSLGLFTNIETSLHISIDNNSESDYKLIQQLKAYFKGIFDFSDPNLKQLNKQIIEDLVKAKIVPTEEERRATHDKVNPDNKETERVILKIFPKRSIATIPREFRGGRKARAKIKKASSSSSAFGTDSINVELLWESGKLTERDLNIPKGINTNPTGSMNFKKGKTKNIDQRNYFRENVFGDLNWMRDTNPKTSHLERVKANFEIIINGEKAGTFTLTISHNTRTDTQSYKQNNSMTYISWGDAKPIIAKEDLIGKSASLYKTEKFDLFILSIQ